jgi:hypothetical protein
MPPSAQFRYPFKLLQLFINDAEMGKCQIKNTDVDIFFWHQISQFGALKGGVNYFYRPGHPTGSLAWEWKA